MVDGIEAVARVGVAAWIGEHAYREAPSPLLGIIGDELYLVELHDGSRARIAIDIVDRFEGDIGGLRIELALFGAGGGFFACSMRYLELWPKSAAQVPVEVFLDNYHKAAFTITGDEVVLTVRHALRPTAAPRRQLRFRSGEYESAMAQLADESCRLRDDLIVVAEQRAPEKVEALQEAFTHWPL